MAPSSFRVITVIAYHHVGGEGLRPGHPIERSSNKVVSKIRL